MSEAGQQSGASPAEVESSLRRFFVERSDGSLTEGEIDPAQHLFEAGYLDSMNALTLLDFVEERFGVEVSEVDLVGGLSTLRALIDHVVQHANPAR